MKRLSNTEAGLKKSVACKKDLIVQLKLLIFFSIQNPVDRAIQKNATGTRNREEGALLNESICDG